MGFQIQFCWFCRAGYKFGARRKYAATCDRPHVYNPNLLLLGHSCQENGDLIGNDLHGPIPR
jgi:hypothetical protein